MRIFEELTELLIKNANNYITIFELKNYTKPFKKSIIGLIILNICAALVGMLNPLLTQNLIDKVLPNKDLHLFYSIFIAYIVIFILALLIETLISMLSTKMTQKMMFDFRIKMQKACSKASYTFLKSRQPGEHIFRFSNDIETVVHIFTNEIPNFFMSIFQLFFFIAISLWYSPKITFLYLAIIPMKITIEFIASKRMQLLQVQLLEIGEKINNFYHESIVGALTIKLFSREKFEEKRIIKILKEQIKLVFKSWKISTFYRIIAYFCGGIWEAFVMFFGWYLVITGEMTIGVLVALQLYLNRLAEPIGNTIRIISTLMQGSVSAKRIQETLYAEQEYTNKKNKLTKCLQGDIKFSNVTFWYLQNKTILKDISFVIKSGMTVGITGPSGAGKTTLINLLLQVYKQSSGEISIDGVNIQTLSLKDLRRHFSIVQQEVFFFHGSIRENIIYGNKYAEDKDIIKAAQAAQAHEFILNLPDGYNTILGGKNGINLSTGQKQRLALARALVKESPILILDEFTASLDAESEYNVLASIQNCFKDKIILNVSHKVSQLMNADYVLVLFNGTIVQSGTPKNLLYQEGMFKKLYQLQYKLTDSQFEMEYPENVMQI